MRAEQILDAIGLIDDEMLEEAEPMKLTAKRSPKYALYAIACAVVIAVLLIPGSYNTLKQAFQNGVTAQQTNDLTADQGEVAINELETFPEDQIQGDIGLFWDDYISFGINELNLYYGTDIRPEYLPVTFDKEMVVDVIYGHLGIFKRQDGTVYYDNNEIKYVSKDKAQSIIIAVAKGHLPRYDVMGLYEGKLKISNIKGNKVLLTHYKNEDGQHYYAEFMHNDVGFNIWGNNISKDEFIKTIESYFDS